MNGKKKTRTLIPIAKKLQIIEKLESGVKPSVICKEFKVAKQTVSDIKKNKLKLRNFAKNGVFLHKTIMKLPVTKVIDEDIYKWCMDRNSKGILIRPRDIQAVARKIAKSKRLNNFTASRAWLLRFLKCNNIGISLDGGLSMVDSKLSLFCDDAQHQKPNNLIEKETFKEGNLNKNEEFREADYITQVLIKEEVISDEEKDINEEATDSSSFSLTNDDISHESVWNHPSTSDTHFNRGFFDERHIEEYQREKQDVQSLSENENSRVYSIIHNDKESLPSDKRQNTELNRVLNIQNDTSAKISNIVSSLNRIEEQFIRLNNTLETIVKALCNKVT